MLTTTPLRFVPPSGEARDVSDTCC